MQPRLFLLLIAIPALAQWVNVPSKGKINLDGPTPRAADGKPDLSGVWEPNANKYVRNIAADLKPEDVPFQPWAKAVFESRVDGSHSKEDPDANCLRKEVPRSAQRRLLGKSFQRPLSLSWCTRRSIYGGRSSWTEGP